jgi:hypothetical protein
MTEEIKTYSTARFFVVAGYYSLDQLRDIVKAAEEQHAVHERLLKRSMEKTEEKGT